MLKSFGVAIECLRFIFKGIDLVSLISSSISSDNINDSDISVVLTPLIVIYYLSDMRMRSHLAFVALLLNGLPLVEFHNVLYQVQNSSFYTRDISDVVSNFNFVYDGYAR